MQRIQREHLFQPSMLLQQTICQDQSTMVNCPLNFYLNPKHLHIEMNIDYQISITPQHEKKENKGHMTVFPCLVISQKQIMNARPV